MLLTAGEDVISNLSEDELKNIEIEDKVVKKEVLKIQK